MGKKTKKSLEVSEEQQVVQQVVQDEFEKEPNPADAEELIPYHTKQASFAMLYLLFFSFLMFTLPFAAFYGTRHILHLYFHIDGFENTCGAVIAAVITVNLVIALYAVFGFREAKREEETVKQFASFKAKTN
jgi:VMA21-like domain